MKTNLATILAIIKDLVTTLGILIAGLWAIWKWGFEQKIKENREMPVLDGQLSVSALSLNDDQIIVTLNLQCKNSGLIPIQIETVLTKICIYKLNTHMMIGRFSPESFKLTPVITVYPHEDRANIIFEPYAEGVLQEHFIIDRQGVYFICWELYRKRFKKSKVYRGWHREVIFTYK